MKNIEIVRMDNQGRGIGYIDGKIVFVPNTLISEIVDVEITSSNTFSLEGKVVE